MSREVMRHGKTIQVRVRLNGKRQQRRPPHEDYGRSANSALQGVRPEVYAKEPETERGGRTAGSKNGTGARRSGPDCRRQFSRSFGSRERPIHRRTNR